MQGDHLSAYREGIVETGGGPPQEEKLRTGLWERWGTIKPFVHPVHFPDPAAQEEGIHRADQSAGSGQN